MDTPEEPDVIKVKLAQLELMMQANDAIIEAKRVSHGLSHPCSNVETSAAYDCSFVGPPLLCRLRRRI